MFYLSRNHFVVDAAKKKKKKKPEGETSERGWVIVWMWIQTELRTKEFKAT